MYSVYPKMSSRRSKRPEPRCAKEGISAKTNQSRLDNGSHADVLTQGQLFPWPAPSGAAAAEKPQITESLANCLPSVRAIQCPGHFPSNSPSFYSFFLSFFFFFCLFRSVAPFLVLHFCEAPFFGKKNQHVSRFSDGIPSYLLLTCFPVTSSQDRWQAARDGPSAELLETLTRAHCQYRPPCPKAPTTYISAHTLLLRHPKKER